MKDGAAEAREEREREETQEFVKNLLNKNWTYTLAQQALNLTLRSNRLALLEPGYFGKLFRGGLLTKLAMEKDGAVSLLGWLSIITPAIEMMPSSIIPDEFKKNIRLVNLVDKDSLTLLLDVVRGNPKAGDKISLSIAAIIDSKDEALYPKLLAQLLRDVVDLGAAQPKEIVSFIQPFLRKVAEHDASLRKNPKFKELDELDKQILLNTTLSLEELKPLIKKKVKLMGECKLSVMETVAFFLRDYHPLIADLNDEKFLQAALASPDKLKDLTDKIAQMVFAFNDNTTQEEVNQNFKAVVSSAVDLLTEKKVAESLKPLATPELIEHIFALPTSAALADYKKLVVDLAESPLEFKELLIKLLGEKKQLGESVGSLIDFISNPLLPIYKKTDTDVVGELDVHLSINNKGEIKTSSQTLDFKGNEALENRIKEWIKQGPELTEAEKMDLYAVTHPKERAKLDRDFEKNLLSWIQTVTDKNILPALINAANKDLIHNIFLLKVMQETSAPKNLEERVASGAREVLETDEMKEVISPEQQQILQRVIPAPKAKQVKKQTETSQFAIGLSVIIRAIDDKALHDALTKKVNLGELLNLIIEKTPNVKEILDKCEINGEDLAKLLPAFSSKSGLAALAKVVENPSAGNIAGLLLSDRRIIGFTIKHVMKYCKNILFSESVAKPTNEIEMVGLSERVERVKKLDHKSQGTTSPQEVTPIPKHIKQLVEEINVTREDSTIYAANNIATRRQVNTGSKNDKSK